jgi:RNA polymerase-interacting CarD/CdnL/TRCF family regulator
MQPEPLNLAVGDLVVYASHGIGCIEARVAGRDGSPETIVVLFTSGLRVTFPVDRARDALRAPLGELELEDVRRTLCAKTPADDAQWTARFRAIREKVAEGAVTGLAEVVRDGVHREQRLAAAPGNGRAGPSERHLYLQARKLLVAEIALARGIDADEADVWIVEQIGGRGPE